MGQMQHASENADLNMIAESGQAENLETPRTAIESGTLQRNDEGGNEPDAE
jgi:hypothetical protein